MAYKSKLLNQAISSLSDSSIQASTNINTLSDISLMSVNPDTEPVIQINADLRTIVIPDELKDIAVAGDHLSETIYFSCPRYFDGNDLSEHKCIIRYINAGNEYGESDVTDLVPESDSIKFGWALDNYVTRYSGTIYFTVQFETVQDTIKYQWQTTPAELHILAGLDIELSITDQDDVLFRTLTNQLQLLQEKVAQLENEISTFPSILQQLEALQNDVNYLKENVVYTLTMT